MENIFEKILTKTIRRKVNWVEFSVYNKLAKDYALVAELEIIQ